MSGNPQGHWFLGRLARFPGLLNNDILVEADKAKCLRRQTPVHRSRLVKYHRSAVP